MKRASSIDFCIKSWRYRWPPRAWGPRKPQYPARQACLHAGGREQPGLWIGLAVFISANAALPGKALGAQPACPSDGTTSGGVASINERLELTLGDGTKVRISGIDPARPTPARPDLDIRGQEKLARWLVGQKVEFRPAEPRLDRWGRVVAFVFARIPAPPETGGQTRLPVGEALIEAGLARYEPGAQAAPCRGVLLKAEESARVSGLGLWADPYYAVIAALDREAFAEKSGSSVIVEGQVTSVSGRRPRITLHFGPRKSWDFSATILPRGSEFEAVYSHFAGLAGRRVRVRGLLDMRFGPQAEIPDLDAVEVIGKEEIKAKPAAASPGRRR